MTMQEFCDLVNIEGIEYTVLHKTNAWQFMSDKKLVKQCKKLVKAHRKIAKKINRFTSEKSRGVCLY